YVKAHFAQLAQSRCSKIDNRSVGVWRNIMGPFPHDAPPAKISGQNPAGTDGFEFVEFAHPRPDELAKLFKRMGYTPVARHKTKAITVYRQGDINYILNAEPGAFATRFVAD